MALPGTAVDIDVTKLFALLHGGNFAGLALSVFKPAYYIRLAGQDTIALEVNGVARLDSSGRATVTMAPIEGGKYAEINKVRQPSQVQATVVIKGFGLTNFDWRLLNLESRSGVKPPEILRKIRTMLDNTELYDIETPKETFSGYDLINFRYQVTHSTGVSMLTVQLIFQEILQVMEVGLSGGIAQSAGTTPLDLTKATAAATALENDRGGIISSPLEELFDATQGILDTFSDKASEAKDATIKFIKDNII